jgi:hypothetical protein
VLPWGVASDDGAAVIRGRLLDETRVDSLVGLDNRRGLFPVHRGVRFLAITTTLGGRSGDIRATFGLHAASALDDLPGRDDPLRSSFPVRLPTSRLPQLGGPLRRIPDLRGASDLVLLERITSGHPPLGSARGWQARFGRDLNATDDREAFGSSGLPVVEGKHIGPFAVDLAAPVRRIRDADAARRLPDRRYQRRRLAYRDVSAVGNRLSLIAAMLPARVVTTHTVFCLRTPMARVRQEYLCGVLNSYVLNFVVRRLMGSHVTTSLVEGLPVPVWAGDRDQRRIAGAARRLSAHQPAPAVAAALQAAVARAYGLDASMFEAIVGDFPLVPSAEREAALSAFRLATAASGGDGP